MNPFERLREIAQVFGLAGGDAPAHWFDSSTINKLDFDNFLPGLI
ncbi:MAG: hypothetical protein ACPL7M_08595 [Bryobacteraceae bacterium]